ncbi:MAG: carboxymuconolactone decarboxylase family protein [Alphaproteobacteria bacterium]|nr:carboxymuconolactone decarboxylase family protein [Alphaproteobacteria bacterium]
MIDPADRLPPQPNAALSPAQRDAAVLFEAERGTPVFGPFHPLLRAPDTMLAMHRLGQQVRYHNSLGQRLAEFIILMVARRHRQALEWDIHAPIARAEGVAEATIADLAQDRRPTAMAADEALVFDALTELWRRDGLSDATWADLVGAFGEAGCINLIVTAGYYTTLAQVMNAARTPSPSGAAGIGWRQPL